MQIEAGVETSWPARDERFSCPRSPRRGQPRVAHDSIAQDEVMPAMMSWDGHIPTSLSSGPEGTTRPQALRNINKEFRIDGTQSLERSAAPAGLSSRRVCEERPFVWLSRGSTPTV